MMFAKDDIEFIQGRLVNTIIAHDGEPYTVASVVSKKPYVYLILTPLDDTEEIIQINIDKVDFRPVPLGFINFDKGGCRYLSRIPHRAWKQGMTNSNITNHGIDIFRYKHDLRNTIINNYPTFAEANKRQVLTAFHRDFCVHNNTISYKDIGEVATYNAGKFTMVPRYFYLQEYLHEVLK
jgi:hypothetical protein